MSKNSMRFANILKKFCSTGLVGALLLVCGCGGSSSPPTTSTNTTAIPAASVTTGAAAGTITVAAGQTVTATTASGVTAISIPAGVTITPPAGTNFLAASPPPIVVTTFNGVSGLPAPNTAGFVVDSVAGAVDLTIGGVNGITFTGGQATITIPITGTVTNCEVFVNKLNGNGYVDLGKGTCSNGVATIKVSNLCTYVTDIVFKNLTTGTTFIPTGSTGSGGSSGTGMGF